MDSCVLLQGYKEMSQRFGSLRRVRGDNYCALRATLFQVLSHTTKLPVWLQEEDIVMVNFHFSVVAEQWLSASARRKP